VKSLRHGGIFSVWVQVLLISVLFVIFFSPFYVQIVYAFKTRAEVATTGLAPPVRLTFINFRNAFSGTNLLPAFYRTMIVTVLVVGILQIAGAMGAWAIARNQNRLGYNSLYYLFLAAIILPFQVVMLPLYTQFRETGLLNTLPGLILGIAGFQIAYNIFLMTGFIKTVPRELEESAIIDGAGLWKMFWEVVYPLLKPITMTTLVLNFLSAWNDFMIAVVIGFKENVRTLQYALYMFFGQYSAQIHEAFAAFIVAVIPVVVLYLVLQRYIISGITSGAIKG
jgi:raffinose/stachyose/melibiose transport system permease protein